MPVVSEMVHPRALSFAQQRRVIVLRDVHELTWDAIRKEVRNLQGKKPGRQTVVDVYNNFKTKHGRRPSQYHRCGRKPWKLTADVERFLLQRLRALRARCACTSTTLQRELLQKLGVQLEASTIRKALEKNGYRWLPRSQKRKYSAKQKRARVQWARATLRLGVAALRAKLSYAMDGVVIPRPPDDPTDRENHCLHGTSHMYRKKGEAAHPTLSGHDDYPDQIPNTRIVAMWAGISENGASIVLTHPRRKLTKGEWVAAVRRGKLRNAILQCRPVARRGPWHVLCDNERFLDSRESRVVHAEHGIRLWHTPKLSPDLNPAEKMWSWLKTKLRRMDLADLRAKRPVPGRTAYVARVRSLLRSQKAKAVAAAHVRSLRKTCREVIRKRGAATRG